MAPSSAVEALGDHAGAARDLVVEVVRARHERSVEAHEASGSRHMLGFASQWRDLYDEANDAFKDRGYKSYRLAPAGWRLPIVNGCLLVVWRVPSGANAIGGFAASKTRRN